MTEPFQTIYTLLKTKYKISKKTKVEFLPSCYHDLKAYSPWPSKPIVYDTEAMNRWPWKSWVQDHNANKT